MSKYKAEPKLDKPGYPSKSKDYAKINAEANREEKRKHPKGYEKLKKIDASLPKGEYAATISKSGKVKVSEKVPKALRKEAAQHDRDELKRLKK